MTPAAIYELERLRESAKKANEAYGRCLKRLYEAEQACDHHFADGRSALKLTSTHPPGCYDYKECAVCAGEQKETFVDVCQVCLKSQGQVRLK